MNIPRFPHRTDYRQEFEGCINYFYNLPLRTVMFFLKCRILREAYGFQKNLIDLLRESIIVFNVMLQLHFFQIMI